LRGEDVEEDEVDMLDAEEDELFLFLAVGLPGMGRGAEVLVVVVEGSCC